MLPFMAPMMMQGGVIQANGLTWNPNDRDASWVLSNANQTATAANETGVASAGIRGLIGKSSGLFGFRVTPTTQSARIGLSNLAKDLNSPTSANATVVNLSNGGVLTDNGSEGSFGAIAPRSKLDFVVDFSGMKVDIFVDGNKLGSSFRIPSGTIYPFAQLGGAAADKNISLDISDTAITGASWR